MLKKILSFRFLKSTKVYGSIFVIRILSHKKVNFLCERQTCKNAMNNGLVGYDYKKFVIFFSVAGKNLKLMNIEKAKHSLITSLYFKQ